MRTTTTSTTRSDAGSGRATDRDVAPPVDPGDAPVADSAVDPALLPADPRPRRFGFGLGSNLGDSVALLAAALDALERRFGPLAVAPLYRTEPVSAVAQPHFLNTVALGSTRESPEALLEFALGIERRLGRARSGRSERDSPRTIDLDLLFVGDELRGGPGLTLPHPRLRERRFVLAPLADLEPGLTLPPDGATVSSLLAALAPRPAVERLGPLRRPSA